MLRRPGNGIQHGYGGAFASPQFGSVSNATAASLRGRRSDGSRHGVGGRAGEVRQYPGMAEPVQIMTHMHLHHHVFLPGAGGDAAASSTALAGGVPCEAGNAVDVDDEDGEEVDSGGAAFFTKAPSPPASAAAVAAAERLAAAYATQESPVQEEGEYPAASAHELRRAHVDASAPAWAHDALSQFVLPSLGEEGAAMRMSTPSGPLGRAGASLALQPPGAAGGQVPVMRKSHSVPAQQMGDTTMYRAPDLSSKYPHSKSATRFRDRPSRLSSSTVAWDDQDRRIEERLHELDAREKWQQSRSLVQRQFREIDDPDKKRRLVGDPRLHDARDRHLIAKLKQEDIQRDRDRVRKIKGVMQECTHSRHQIMQMQQLFKGRPEEEKSSVDTDFLAQLMHR